MGLLYSTSAWTNAIWHQITQREASAKEEIARGEAKVGNDVRAFLEDVHSSLYLPHTPTERQIDNEWPMSVLLELSANPDWQRLKAMCRNREINSGIATHTLLPTIIDLLPEPEEDNQNGSGSGQGDGTPDPDGTDGQPTPTDNGNTPTDPEERQKAISQAIRDAMENVQNVEDMQDAIGVNPGNAYVDPDSMRGDALDLASMVDRFRHDRKIKDIVRLAGRMKAIASFRSADKIPKAHGSIRGLTIGGDINLVLPQELVGLRSKSRLIKLNTLQKIVSKRALQYEPMGYASAGMGPIIVCQDMSSSMGDFGNRHILASALSMAILMTAQEQRRGFAHIRFNWEADGMICRPGDTATGKKILERILIQYPGGGTDFENPLRLAMEYLEKNGNISRADIIFLTDGEGWTTGDTQEEIANLKKSIGLKVFGIGVDISEREKKRKESIESMSQFCDTLTFVTSDEKGGALTEEINLI